MNLPAGAAPSCLTSSLGCLHCVFLVRVLWISKCADLAKVRPQPWHRTGTSLASEKKGRQINKQMISEISQNKHTSSIRLGHKQPGSESKPFPKLSSPFGRFLQRVNKMNCDYEGLSRCSRWYHWHVVCIHIHVSIFPAEGFFLCPEKQVLQFGHELNALDDFFCAKFWFFVSVFVCVKMAGFLS